MTCVSSLRRGASKFSIIIAKMMALVAALTVSVALMACNRGAAMSDEPSFSMELDEASLAEGRVVLQSKLKNTTKAAVAFLPWGTPFESKLSGRFLKILVDNGADGEPERLPYMGRMFKRAEPDASDYVTLEVRSSYENDLDITSSYDFCPNRSYILIYQGSLFLQDSTEIQVPQVRLSFETGGAFAPCPD